MSRGSWIKALTLAVALLGCGLLLFFALLGGFGMWRGVLACLAALAASYGVGALAKTKIGGQTGDVAGAAQVLAEIAIYAVLAIGRGGLGL